MEQTETPQMMENRIKKSNCIYISMFIVVFVVVVVASGQYPHKT